MLIFLIVGKKEIDVPKKWIQKATSKMKQKGTLGSFGKATKKKIAAGKKAGGKRAKKAVFAQNVARAARKRTKR
jgi:hypothetical protein